MSDRDEALPGLEPPARPAGVLEAAVRATITALAAEAPGGQLPATQAARTALAVELAQVIEEKRAQGRMSTLGNDARVLMELLDKLAPVDEAGVDEQLAEAMKRWEDAIEQEQRQ